MKPFKLPDGVLETVNNVVVSEVDSRTVKVSCLTKTGEISEILFDTYDLAHRCKIWAFKQWYDILSSVDHEFDSDGNSKFIGYAYPCGTKSIEHLSKPLSVEIVGESEAEAIFKAVDWIVKDIKNETLN
jgi:hypothetical protein